METILVQTTTGGKSPLCLSLCFLICPPLLLPLGFAIPHSLVLGIKLYIQKTDQKMVPS